MKRGGPLKRGKPLRADPAKVAAWQRRSRKRLPARSAKRIAEQPERDEVREAVFKRDGYRCRFPVHHRCIGPLTPHHLLKASAGGPYTPANLLSLCAWSNSWVEDHPTEATELGLVVRG